jgi:hypothetical protein
MCVQRYINKINSRYIFVSTISWMMKMKMMKFQLTETFFYPEKSLQTGFEHRIHEVMINNSSIHLKGRDMMGMTIASDSQQTTIL